MGINNIKFIFYLFFSFLILSSCKKDKETFDPGYTFYPIEIGNYKIFQVQKITFYPNDTIVENFEIKEVVADQFTINGESRYRLERYKRLNNTLAWPVNPDSIWTVSITEAKVVSIENNIRFVKLVFPVSNGKTWDGNIENNYGEEEYKFKNVGKSFTVISQTFPNTASVIESDGDSSSYISKDFRENVYEKDIGLIFKAKEIYEYRQLPGGGGIDTTYKISEGIRYYERLISYGHQ